MIIIEDSRQQIGKHKQKLDYFAAQGIKTVRTKLFCGDFSRLDCQTICIDTKQDLLELSSNICGKQHPRFRNECIRAAENGIKLIVLVEEDLNIDNLADWKSPVRKLGKLKGQPFTQIKGETLAKAMRTMTEKYGVDFLFCNKADSGAKIIELLK